MKTLSTLLLLTIMLLLGGCYTSPVKPPLGIIFTQVTHPVTMEFRDTPVEDDGTRMVSDKTTGFYIDLFLNAAFGESDVDLLARRGGLTEVHYAEGRYTNVLGIYQEVELLVYGR